MAVTNLPFVQKEMIRYGMTTYLVLGLVGNICNCIIFTHHLHRGTSSSVYFLALSIFAIIYLIWASGPMLYTLNYPDPQNQSLVYCKIRLFVNHVLGQYLRYIVVFACVDRFFVTRTNVRIRSLNSIKVAGKLILIMCVICTTIAIHLPILMDIRNGTCAMYDLYKLIYAIYQITIVGILPPVLMCIFSILTIRSLHQRHGTLARARKRDRYLMRMVIGEVIVNVFTSIPYSSNLVYGAVTYYVANKSAERLEIEAFMSFFTQFLVYFISVVPFYLFMLTSKPFRNEFINLSIKFWNKYVLRRTRIVPLNEQNNITASVNDRQ